MAYAVARVSWVENVKKSVVKINAVERMYNWREPYKLGRDIGVCGSGFFVDQMELFGRVRFPGQRIVLTNSHVVEGTPTKQVRLMFPGTGKSYIEASVAYLCESVDFAILIIDPRRQSHWFEIDVSAEEFLESRDNLEFEERSMRGNGEECIAVGYPHDSEDSVATVGCIACRSENMFQLAMSINDGNSGGAICYNGKVIGIATSTLAEAEGISYGVPIKQVASFVQHWLRDTPIGSLLIPPSFGVETRPASKAFFESIATKSSGALVQNVQPNSSFDKAGLKEGDILTSIVTINNKQKYEFPVDSHGLVKVPWSLAKVELDNLDFVLFCDKKKTKIHFLTKMKSKKRSKTTRYKSVCKKAPIFMCRKNAPTLVPYWDNIQHILFGGMVLMNLSANHASAFKNTCREHSKTDPRFLFKLLETNGDEKMVCVSHVYPQSVISDTQTLEDLTIITAINGKEVTDIEEVAKLLKKAVANIHKDPFVHFSTETHDDIVFDIRELVAQEQMFLSAIPHHPTNTILNIASSVSKKRKNIASSVSKKRRKKS